MTLDDKIEQAMDCLVHALAWADPARIAVAWTGGKDSTVALALWRDVCKAQGIVAPVQALNLDTGVKFPEVLSFRDRMTAKWGISLSIVRPDVDLAAYPVAQDPLQCCRELKILPLKKALAAMDISVLITGVRADEHPERGLRSWFEKRDDPVHTMLNPLLYWTEMDIWAFILQRGLPYCSLYDHGYRSLGCRPCTRLPHSDERSGRNQRKEETMHILRSLGYF